MRRLIVYGGTFDPPHEGHLHLLKSAMQQLKIKHAMVVPTLIPPHKEAGQQWPPQVRLNAVKRLVEDLPGVEVSAIELERGGKSYTIDTVETILSRYPDTKLYLLMGSDMFFTIDTWKRAAQLFEKCTIVTAARRQDEQQQIEEKRQFLLTSYPSCDIIVCNIDVVSVSSAEIRRGERSDMVPSRVSEYLQQEKIRLGQD